MTDNEHKDYVSLMEKWFSVQVAYSNLRMYIQDNPYFQDKATILEKLEAEQDALRNFGYLADDAVRRWFEKPTSHGASAGEE